MKLAGWVAASALAHGALLAAVMLGVIPLEYAEVEPEPACSKACWMVASMNSSGTSVEAVR